MPEFSTTVKMNTLISTFHFLLHNYTAHLSNVLKLSRRFATQWNLLCWKYKIHKFYFWVQTQNPRIYKSKPWKLMSMKKGTFTVIPYKVRVVWIMEEWSLSLDFCSNKFQQKKWLQNCWLRIIFCFKSCSAPVNDSLPILKHVLKNGNTTTYEWRTGTKPEKVDLTKVVIDTTDEQDPVVTDSVDVRLLINMIRLIRLGSSPPSPLPMREHKYRNRASVLQGTCLWKRCSQAESKTQSILMMYHKLEHHVWWMQWSLFLKEILKKRGRGWKALFSKTQLPYKYIKKLIVHFFNYWWNCWPSLFKLSFHI